MSAPLTSLNFSDLSPFFKAAGFEAVGAVDYQKALPLYQEHAERYRNWITTKKHGEMRYLERGLERRLDPTLVFPELKSVIAVALPHDPHPAQVQGLKYARYLNGADYHDSIKQKLEEAIRGLKGAGLVPESFQYKICVDTSAVLERSWALLCGLGWIGKNTLLIHPQLGSYLFLGVVFTNAEFGLAPQLLKDYCGECTRCIRSCPTGALQSHDLDARECISYLTLEKRGEWNQAYPTSGFLAGCDLCQEACPYNTKAVKVRPQSEMASHLVFDAEILRGETESAYKKRVEGTALSRIKYADFRRNLEAVLGDAKPVDDDRIL
jgi:epoxyqueuosine reductase